MPTERVDYRRIANEIAEKIESGELASGTKLPSTRELADTYGVHISTIGRVMSILKDRGVVVGQPGKGVYVAEPE
ncbi:GntR family transcriptional regulator [Micromonospora sp. NBS 11-29]|uniref:GntR family transcriptional regulator n=1 Tax=Micromonospora sp. NBS 11-29 TaxID=1960879 RepID=UPI000B7825B9|nr:winged helix-turn-helix domain-containing protein [Micromonospora sp. NBS 11-29]